MKSATLKMVDKQELHIGVNDEKRAQVAEALSTFLASTYTLYMQTLYFHWNVTGKEFFSLHELFEKQYQDLHQAGDKIAERIRALGHFCPGTYAEFNKLSAITEAETLPTSAEQMVKTLLSHHETASLEARKVLEVAEDGYDEVTVDMMVSRMTFHDEAAWMLRSTLE